MSETSINTLFHHSDPAVLRQAMAIIGDKHQETTELGYVVVDRTDLDAVVLAELLGGSSIDTDTLLKKLRELKPVCLGLEIYPDDGSRIAPQYFKNGRKVKKNTVINTLRKECVEFDLYYALEKADNETVQRILQTESINADIAIGGTPLVFLVIESDDVDALELLVERGADINAVINADLKVQNQKGEFVHLYKGTTLLMAAVHYKSPKVAAWLIEHGSNINGVDRNGDSALLLMPTETSMHDLLIPAVEAGAEINHENPRGITPLFAMIYADGKSQQYIIDHCKRLMEHGADIHHVSKNGMNARWAAHMAETNAPQRKVVKFVESFGITRCRAPEDFYARYGSTSQMLRWALHYNDKNTFSSLFSTDELSPGEMLDLLWAMPRRHHSEEFLRVMFEQGAPGFILGSHEIIDTITSDPASRSYLKDIFEDSGPARVEYLSRCEELVNRFAEFLANYSDQLDLPDYIPHKDEQQEQHQRSNLRRFTDEAKSADMDTMTSVLTPKLKAVYAIRLTDSRKQLYILVNPETMKILRFIVAEPEYANW